MKILYWVSEDWYFVSHRLRLALKAQAQGHDVYVVTNIGEHGALLRESGLTVIPLGLNRSGFNPFSDLLILFRLWAIYRNVSPDVVHHVAVKPVLYGSLIARVAGVPKVINALAGLGYIFSSGDRKARILRPLVACLFRSTLNAPNSYLIVQNRDDFDQFHRLVGVANSRLKLIRGAGLCVSDFMANPEPAGRVRAVLLARLLKDKGVIEFVGAARILRDRGSPVDMILVGDIDERNPSAISATDLAGWQADGLVEWWGFQSDIQAVWDHSHISVLPSYREGLPKSLLESCACGRPVIATDVPGCREVVGEANGVLVPVRSSVALADAIDVLASDKVLRGNMGMVGRAKVEREFSSVIVDAATLDLYVN